LGDVRVQATAWYALVRYVQGNYDDDKMAAHKRQTAK